MSLQTRAWLLAWGFSPHLDAIKGFNCHLNVQAGQDDAGDSLHNFSTGSSPGPDFPTPTSCKSQTSRSHHQLSEPFGEGEKDPDPGAGGQALVLVVPTEPGPQLGTGLGIFPLSDPFLPGPNCKNSPSMGSRSLPRVLEGCLPQGREAHPGAAICMAQAAAGSEQSPHKSPRCCTTIPPPNPVPFADGGFFFLLLCSK